HQIGAWVMVRSGHWRSGNSTAGKGRYFWMDSGFMGVLVRLKGKKGKGAILPCKKGSGPGGETRRADQPGSTHPRSGARRSSRVLFVVGFIRKGGNRPQVK